MSPQYLSVNQFPHLSDSLHDSHNTYLDSSEPGEVGSCSVRSVRYSLNASLTTVCRISVNESCAEGSNIYNDLKVEETKELLKFEDS